MISDTFSNPAQSERARRAAAIPGYFYREIAAGGFSRRDGTLQFYARVNALLDGRMIVLDLGAGRGVLSECSAPALRRLVNLRGKARQVVGIDVDPAVSSNPLVDCAVVYDGQKIPLDSESVDLIVSDHTFEHISDPSIFAREIHRVLKPGGWICARTPYIASLHAIGSMIAGNSRHVRLLKLVQPMREEADVFPTAYLLNSHRAIRRWFPAEKWTNASYTWTPEPSYYFASKALFWLLLMYYLAKQPLFGEVLLVFLKKK